MTKLPTIESLDEAARCSGNNSWSCAERIERLSTRLSIIAHARTLDELHNRTPVDPDVEALERVLGKWMTIAPEKCWADHHTFPAALAQYKAEKAKWEGRE